MKRVLVVSLAFLLVGCDRFSGTHETDAQGTESDALQERAEQGDADAQWRLGQVLDSGSHPYEALEWIRRSALQGNAEAQYRLATKYENGPWVPQDFVEAVKWYRLGAEQGHLDSQLRLRLLGEAGMRVYDDAFDQDDALDWIRRSALQGNADSQYKLAHKHEFGLAVRG